MAPASQSQYIVINEHKDAAISGLMAPASQSQYIVINEHKDAAISVINIKKHKDRAVSGHQHQQAQRQSNLSTSSSTNMKIEQSQYIIINKHKDRAASVHHHQQTQRWNISPDLSEGTSFCRASLGHKEKMEATQPSASDLRLTRT